MFASFLQTHFSLFLSFPTPGPLCSQPFQPIFAASHFGPSLHPYHPLVIHSLLCLLCLSGSLLSIIFLAHLPKCLGIAGWTQVLRAPVLCPGSRWGNALFRPPPPLSWKMLLHSVDLEICHCSFQVEIFVETCNITRLRWYFVDMAKIISLALTIQIFNPKPGETEAIQGKKDF